MSSSFRYALGLCAAGILAGCGGGTNVTPTHSAGLVQNDREASVTALLSKPATGFLNGEVFKSHHVSINIVGGQCHRGGYTVDFTATGRARGPYRGKFTATGSWGLRACGRSCAFWFFNETFAIAPRTSTINGTISADGYRNGPVSCTSFGAATGLPYTVQGEARGDASTTGISEGVLGESFQ
jgi:hypothetical protein